jgi:outer membrane protein assembly factor BamB
MKSFLIIIWVASLTTLHAADWPQFRGPFCNGVSDETGVLSTFTLAQNLSWKSDLPGRGLSSPIVIGNRVFVTCCSGPKQGKLHVLCFNAESGVKLWERQFWATGRTMCQSKMSVAAPTPASDGERIVAIFSSNDIVCLDMEGNLLWLRGLGRDYPNASNSVGMSSSLVIVDRVVIAQVESESEAFTAGLDVQHGLTRWKLDRPRKANWTSPVILKEGQKKLVALQSSKGVTAIDPANGKTVWQYADGGSSIPSMAASEGVHLWQSNQLRPGTASLTVVGQKVFALSDAGILTCGDTATGNRLWQLRLKGPFSATPVAAGKFLYCVSEKGVAQVVDISKPEGEIVNELELGVTILSTPSISQGAIYFRSDARLWRIGKPSSKPSA